MPYHTFGAYNISVCAGVNGRRVSDAEAHNVDVMVDVSDFDAMDIKMGDQLFQIRTGGGGLHCQLVKIEDIGVYVQRVNAEFGEKSLKMLRTEAPTKRVALTTPDDGRAHVAHLTVDSLQFRIYSDDWLDIRHVRKEE